MNSETGLRYTQRGHADVAALLRLHEGLAQATGEEARLLRKVEPTLRHNEGCFGGGQVAGQAISMISDSNCSVNAVGLTLFKTIKTELSWLRTQETRRAAKRAIFEHIIGFYNQRRRHLALSRQSLPTLQAKAA